MILKSDFIRNNKEIGEDQNFHYENINFTFKDGILILEPPIDFELSQPFLYPDDERE